MSSRVRRLLLPTATFFVVLAVHYVWTGLFPERDPEQDRWLSVPGAERSWLRSYLESQSYWLGYSYALALSFAVVALRRYQEHRLCAARNLAIGGVTLSGFLAVAGCFLLGCCGSPMLAVYLSLLGASFLPFARPLVAGITTITIVAGWFWLSRRVPRRVKILSRPTTARSR
jgi:hypothetical protein